MKRGFALALCLALISGVLVGCSKTNRLGVPTYKVTGKVLLDGVPVGGATVMFMPAPGQTIQSANAVSDESGNYSLTTLEKGDGAMEGKYRITVSKTTQEGKPLTAEQEAEQMKNYTPVSGPVFKYKEELPEKYKSPATSGLEFDVTKPAKSGDKLVHDIELKK